jgi:low affinity Fe/Cu permease
MHDIFRRFAVMVSQFTGSGWALALTIILVVGGGWYAGFSHQWRLDAAGVLALASLLLLIFLQKSQNHGDRATHLKLDELIRSSDGARNEVTAAEHRAEKEIAELDTD